MRCIRAIERLLELYPEHREKVVLLQLAVPSRFQVAEYQELKREIDELVGRVNGRFASADCASSRSSTGVARRIQEPRPPVVTHAGRARSQRAAGPRSVRGATGTRQSLAEEHVLLH